MARAVGIRAALAEAFARADVDGHAKPAAVRVALALTVGVAATSTDLMVGFDLQVHVVAAIAVDFTVGARSG